MCGRFSLSVYQLDLVEEFGVQDIPPGYRQRYNIAPSQEVLAITVDADGAPRPAWLRWGLIPAWAKDPSIGNRMINARAETIADKPAFRHAFTHRRCLVLADGFFEWQRAGSRKVPIRVRLASGKPFALAGIAERWQPERQEAVESCAIVTTSASDFMKPIHDRMPVILGRRERERWLDPAAEREELLGVLRPYDGADLEAYPVSTLVNSPANDRPEVFEPADPEEDAEEETLALPGLG